MLHICVIAHVFFLSSLPLHRITFFLMLLSTWIWHIAVAMSVLCLLNTTIYCWFFSFHFTFYRQLILIRSIWRKWCNTLWTNSVCNLALHNYGAKTEPCVTDSQLLIVCIYAYNMSMINQLNKNWSFSFS